MSTIVQAEQHQSPVARHHPIGASTGYMDAQRGNWNAQINLATEVSRFAIELSALSEHELTPLFDFLSSRPPLPFRYLSVHGPSKGRQLGEAELVQQLCAMSEWCDAIVMHPDTIESPGHYRPLGQKLLLENMDERKAWGRTVDELDATFAELPEAGFCFDIAHAWSIDASMTTAGDILDRFGDRLRHVHLSSLSPELHHVPLTEEDEDLFSPLLERCIDVPWILEAPPRPGMMPSNGAH